MDSANAFKQSSFKLYRRRKKGPIERIGRQTLQLQEKKKQKNKRTLLTKYHTATARTQKRARKLADAFGRGKKTTGEGKAVALLT